MDQQRVQQFEKMAREDPDNELGHFSLGKAYLESGRFDDAVGPLRRAIEIRPGMSKAYQLLGEAYDKGGQRDAAVEIVTKGAGVADEQGDVMPRDTMAKLLESWNAPVPKFRSSTSRAASPSPSAGAAEGYQCARCGRPGGKLPKQPFKGPLGLKVLENVCESCWREWIPMGTKVINELGLTLSSPQGQESYDQYMIEFLQLEDR